MVVIFSMARLTRAILLFGAIAIAIAASGSAFAQARAGDDNNVAPSPLAPVFAQFDEALVPRLIGADDAGSHWISGRLSALEPRAQGREYAAAVAREPKELLYVASLAVTCLRAPGLAECSERDPVGYWVARDGDNAVPWMLQAERARRRNNMPAFIDNLERASRAGRYESYDHRAGAVVLSKLAHFAPADQRAAAALYAMNAVTVSGPVMQVLEDVCAAQSRALEPRIGASCMRLAGLMADRASMLNDRRAGTQLALATTSNETRVAASERAREVVDLQDRCREGMQALERAALGTAEQRARAATAGEQFIATRAREGEASACEALSKSVAAR
jgi:hypothetical protein